MAVTRQFVKQRFFGGLWAAVWMWPLINPVVAIAQGKVAHAGWAGSGLAAFVVLYLVVVTNGFDQERPRATRVDVAMLLVLAAIGMALLMTYGFKPDGWLGLAIYIAVAGAAILGPALTASWVLSVCGIVIGWALTAPRPPHIGIAGELGPIIFGALLASGLVHTVKQMIRYIHQLRETRASLARTAVDEERLRFSRDLHDLLGHTISTIVVKAEVVRRLVDRDPALAAAAAADIEAIGRRALSDVRRTVDGYRSPGFEAELAGVRPVLADSGIEVRFRHYGPTPPAPAAAAFGWVVREAATNMIRHSGARNCDIIMTVDDHAAKLEVSDDGHGRPREDRRGSAGGSAESRAGAGPTRAGAGPTRTGAGPTQGGGGPTRAGAEPARTGAGPARTGGGPRWVGAGPTRVGAGLIGLAERVEAAGGTLTAANRPGGGFALTATIPHGTEAGCVAIGHLPDLGALDTPGRAPASKIAGAAEPAEGPR